MPHVERLPSRPGALGDTSTSLCQRYCCKDADSCGADTYCTERPLRDAAINAAGSAAASPLMIPVCVPAENCDLSAPYPCTAGTQCACKAGHGLLGRALRRRRLETGGRLANTCAVPGKGKAGDACPCAWDHVCSAATNQCLKLCLTSGATSCDNGGVCQSAAELPDGWGVSSRRRHALTVQIFQLQVQLCAQEQREAHDPEPTENDRDG